MRLRATGNLFLLLFAWAPASCSRSVGREFSTEMQTATSWATTAQMAGEAWLQRAVPTHYARRTSETAVETLLEIKRDPGKMGKVDGLIMVLRKDQPPRLAYIELGMGTLADRLHPRLGEWVEALGRKWGPRQGKPFRVPWSKVHLLQL